MTKKEVEHMVRKVSQEVIKSRDGKKWKNNGNRCAYDFNSEVIQVQEDLGRALEEELRVGLGWCLTLFCNCLRKVCRS